MKLLTAHIFLLHSYHSKFIVTVTSIFQSFIFICTHNTLYMAGRGRRVELPFSDGIGTLSVVVGMAGAVLISLFGVSEEGEKRLKM